MIRSDCPPQAYSKVYLPASTSFNGIQVELIGVGCERQLYLSVLCLQFPSSEESDDIAYVVVTIADESYVVSGALLEGKQRVLMPDEAQMLIVNALLRGEEVEIAVGRYRQVLVIENFVECFKP